MKNNGVLYVIIIVLTAIVCLMGGFFLGNSDLFDKDNDKEVGDSDISNENNFNENNENKTETITDLSISSSIVTNLSSKVIGIYTNSMITPYSDYFYKKDKIILADESISFKLSLAADSLSEDSIGYYDKKDSKCNEGICRIAYINESTLKNAYYELFGKNSNYSRASFSADSCANEYSWSSENGRYEATVLEGCGGASFGGVMSELGYAKQIASKSSDKIELYEYFAVMDPSTSNDKIVNYYSDYNSTILITTTNYDDMYSLTDANSFFNKFKEKAGVYKYTFVKDANGNYVFTSVERVK